jgi:hypothetical protein
MRKKYRAAGISCSALIVFFILEGQYAPAWWIVFGLTSIVLVPYFVVSMCRAASFWVKNRSHSEAYNPFLIYVATIIFVICLPGADHSKQYFARRIELIAPGTEEHQNLYLDCYHVFRSFMTTDIDAEYLTDAHNFRLFLGTYDEGIRSIDLKIAKDSVIINNWDDESNDPNFPRLRLRNRKTYSLKDLQRRHVFD